MRNLKKEQFGGLRPLAVFSIDIALVAPLRHKFGLFSIRVYVCDACCVAFEVVVTSLMSRCQDVMTYPLGRLLVEIGKF